MTASQFPEVFPRSWLYLFPPVYFAHLIDERFFGMGIAAWATTHMGVYLTNHAWLIINIVWFLMLSVVAWLVSRGTWPEWVALALATHLAVHSLTRIWGTVVFPGWSPGVVTGVTLGMPWALLIFARGLRCIKPSRVALGVACGVLSLQPLWDFLMLPVLSPRPPAV